jgi:glycosyltransferase involved in cell wall biosynthesis
VEYALKYKWGYVVADRSIEKIKQAIIDLYNNEILRETLGKTAKKVAMEKHDSNLVCNEFRSILSTISGVHKYELSDYTQ